MSTPATPGTRSRCWRIFQYEIEDSSMRSSWSEELPRAIVWISTWGGANSGKTSTFDSGILASENAMNVAARKMTIQRKWRLRATIQRISVGSELELGAVDLRN